MRASEALFFETKKQLILNMPQKVRHYLGHFLWKLVKATGTAQQNEANNWRETF